jgi:exportin-1
VTLAVSFPEDAQMQSQNQFLLTKLNATLISIVKFEWKTTWQNFIPDICNNARESVNKCANALNILKLLSEEVFSFSKGNILNSDVQFLKTNFNEQFGQVYGLCEYVLSQALQNGPSFAPQLVKSCLRTLQAFFFWIPLPYIFDTQLIEVIINHFIEPPNSRIEAIKCITEISSLDFKEIDDPNLSRRCKEKLCYFYCLLIQRIHSLTKGRSLLDEYNATLQTKQQAGFENFARQVALAISSVLRNNLDLIEEMTNIAEMNENTAMLVNTAQQGLIYLVQLSNVPEDELFKISMNFWHFFASDVLSKTRPISLGHIRNQEIPLDNNLDFSNFSTQLTQANKLTLMHH